MRIHFRAGRVCYRLGWPDQPHRVATAVAGTAVAAVMVFSVGGVTASAHHDGPPPGHPHGLRAAHGGGHARAQHHEHNHPHAHADDPPGEGERGSGRGHQPAGNHGNLGLHGGSGAGAGHPPVQTSSDAGATVARPAISPARPAISPPMATAGTPPIAELSKSTPATSVPETALVRATIVAGRGSASGNGLSLGRGGSGPAAGGLSVRPTPPATVIPVLGMSVGPGLSRAADGVPVWARVIGSLSVLLLVAAPSLRGARVRRRSP